MKAEDMLEGRGTPDPMPTNRHEPSVCPHEGFSVDAVVNRMADSGGFVADIRIKCVQCDEAFRFLGVPAGFNFESPTVSIDEIELHVPIEPEGNKQLQTRALFQMPEQLKRN